MLSSFEYFIAFYVGLVRSGSRAGRLASFQVSMLERRSCGSGRFGDTWKLLSILDPYSSYTDDNVHVDIFSDC